jgi:aerobic-type carbon monoxide dehydrogenase small subunit (CoxS/CutS family)
MQITVNGTSHEIPAAGHETLLSVLRDRLGLTGTKLSCGRGECGACTVLLSAPGTRRRAVYSCLTLAAACDAASVTTIEGLSGSGTAEHPLQQAFIARDAVQCGFCTPGQILAATALLDENLTPSEAEIRVALSGNLCRCGTYPKIVLAVQDAGRQMEALDGR